MNDPWFCLVLRRQRRTQIELLTAKEAEVHAARAALAELEKQMLELGCKRHQD